MQAPAETQVVPDDAAGLGALAAPRTIRTLVVSADPAYRERARRVLVPLGPVAVAVVGPGAPGDLVSILAHGSADVVVLDASDDEASARRAITALAETAPRTGVVVVCQHCTPAATDLRALPKWGWTQDLLAAVAHAADDGNPTIPTARRRLRRSRPPAPRGAGIASSA